MEEIFRKYVRKIISEGEEGYIKLMRGQNGEVDSPWDFAIAADQHGEGVYAFLYGDKKMIEYYI